VIFTLSSPQKLLDTTANPLYTSYKHKRILQSDEQEKYLASHGHREPGLLETGTRAVKEWAWELKSEPFVTPLANRNSRPLTERPPLSRTGYKDVSGNEGLSSTFWSRWI